ncbi:cytochrome P450 [Frankia sp. CNm7]|uniref:Cytochrome P450 n=1 Tax=Frankia nepalensis TaxID=1836974 RepID=A0A937RNF6_9ACTN|nr:cytochrome P450 [Frankia nepalensis]MBL7497493.1 cytochrome P450 [Frankia nepalensis]MBL7509566.1 cytochrome P450 [Frankia nepalensis]MBL7517740.1 cytochrome P450 [Frankia nepalensis]MBL7633395.1 cytochrome P450 [Frankia nepalensis]
MVEFNPYDLATYRNPYPVYRVLRDEAPVFHNPELKFWALSRHADVLAAHNDWETYSSAGGVTIEGREAGSPMIILRDPPEHRWHRKIVSKVFSPRRMLALEPYIRRRAAELLDRFRDVDEFDVVRNFSVLLPLDVISELLGIPEEYRATINECSDRMLARGEGVDEEAEFIAANVEIINIYLSLAAERRKNPTDDPISLLIQTEVLDDEDGSTRALPDDEIAFRFLELGTAGHETVAKAIPNGLMALTRFPEQRRLLLADPSLYDRAAGETLRYDAPSQLQGRTATRDIELHGVTIPAGDRVMLITGSALRDERVYADPDTFDLNRRDEPSTLFFGFGIHRCLGAHLARLETRIALEEILNRFPDFVADPDRAVMKVSSNVRGAANLPLVTKGAAIAAA